MTRFAAVAVVAVLAFAAAASAGGSHGDQSLPGTIAFSGGTQAAGYHVFLARPDGAITQATHEATRRSVPEGATWSPDGSRFLVVGDDGIYVLPADGSSEIRVAGLANGYAGQGVTWSPDSRRIAFSEADTLYVVNADGSGGLERLARPADAPSWSPDGAQIVYSGGDASRRPALFVVNTVGRPRPRRLWPATPGARRKGCYPWAIWSPEGSRIAFECNSGYNPLGGWIYSIRPDGTGQRFLYRGDIGPWSPNWSPDGRTLVVTRGFNAFWKLFLVQADGTSVRQLPGCAKGCGEVTWFPDGKRLGYLEAGAIYVARTDGSSRQVVARTHASYEGFSVSADGSTIAYTDGDRARDHNRRITIVGADGRGRRIVVQSSKIRYWALAWRPRSR